MIYKNIYAVYKGDEFLDLGTAEELAKRFKVKKETVWFWNSTANKRRAKKKRKIAIKIEEDLTNENIKESINYRTTNINFRHRLGIRNKSR